MFVCLDKIKDGGGDAGVTETVAQAPDSQYRRQMGHIYFLLWFRCIP